MIIVPPCSNISGAILAGGRNSRMGGVDKAFLQVEGRPLIQKTIELFKEIFSEVIVVTNTPDRYKADAAGVKIMTDEIKGAGPLGGIYTALRGTEKEAVFFAACDMPFLHNETIGRQIAYYRAKNCDALVPRVGGFIEPLHTIFKKSVADKIPHFLPHQGGGGTSRINVIERYSIRNFLRTIDVCYWDLEYTPFYRKMFKNINTEKDAAALCK